MFSSIEPYGSITFQRKRELHISKRQNNRITSMLYYSLWYTIGGKTMKFTSLVLGVSTYYFYCAQFRMYLKGLTIITCKFCFHHCPFKYTIMYYKTITNTLWRAMLFLLYKYKIVAKKFIFCDALTVHKMYDILKTQVSC